jgi:hypothetical protein
LEPRLKLLQQELRRRRVLLVLDNLESLLQAGDLKGRLRPGFAVGSRGWTAPTLAHRAGATGRQLYLALGGAGVRDRQAGQHGERGALLWDIVHNSIGLCKPHSGRFLS